MKNFGKKNQIDYIKLKDWYFTLARNHESAARCLSNEKLYGEAVFMLIQAMEKKITGLICSKINMSNPYFSKKIREIGHRMDHSVDFLIEILSGKDIILKHHLVAQLKSGVLEDLKFNVLYNECRYPYPIQRQPGYYSMRLISEKDYLRLNRINCKLDAFINDLIRL